MSTQIALLTAKDDEINVLAHISSPVYKLHDQFRSFQDTAYAYFHAGKKKMMTFKSKGNPSVVPGHLMTALAQRRILTRPTLAVSHNVSACQSFHTSLGHIVCNRLQDDRAFRCEACAPECCKMTTTSLKGNETGHLSGPPENSLLW